MVVLLDIDNWGFESLATEPAAKTRLPEDCFFWLFYGAGFEAFWSLDLETADWAAYGKRRGAVDKTLFADLQQRQRLWFSPAGGHKQAADLAILQTVALLRNMHVVVVSGDRELRAAAAKKERSPAPDGKPRFVGTVAPTGKFGEVWGKLLNHYDKFTGGAMW